MLLAVRGEAALPFDGDVGDVGSALDAWQLMAGVGPSLDAAATGICVNPFDLARARVTVSWPGFAPVALGEGIRTVLAVPMLVGRVHLGVLSLYGERPGAANAARRLDAMVYASALAREIALASIGEGPLGTRAADGAVPVHQAVGVVAESLGIDVGEALVRLRGHAFVTGRTLGDVAGDVLGGLLRLSP